MINRELSSEARGALTGFSDQVLSVHEQLGHGENTSSRVWTPVSGGTSIEMSVSLMNAAQEKEHPGSLPTVPGIGTGAWNNDFEFLSEFSQLIKRAGNSAARNHLLGFRALCLPRNGSDGSAAIRIDLVDASISPASEVMNAKQPGPKSYSFHGFSIDLVPQPSGELGGRFAWQKSHNLVRGTDDTDTRMLAITHERFSGPIDGGNLDHVLGVAVQALYRGAVANSSRPIQFPGK